MTQILILVCGPSPTIAFGSPLLLPEFPVNVGENVTYVCDENYIFKGIGDTVTIECLLGGFWSKISNCVGKSTANKESERRFIILKYYLSYCSPR